MAEPHARGTLSWRPVTPEEGGAGQSAMARASDARPFKPYVYDGGEKEPAAVTAARERHRQLSDEIERAQKAALQRLAGQRLRERAAEAMPDPAPGYEWYRELADDE